jgi:hypothetical protein
MDTTKIKIKIGNHEFEAEGPVETVQAQFDIFKDLVGTTLAQSTPTPAIQARSATAIPSNSGELPHIPLEKIVHVSGRVVSLTALPATTEDAALLIILGHKDLRNNVSVTGQEIGDGLAQSGRPVARVDRVMDKAITEAHVLKTGIKRATRYRLTNQGLTKALNVANDLIASLP